MQHASSSGVWTHGLVNMNLVALSLGHPALPVYSAPRHDAYNGFYMLYTDALSTFIYLFL